MFLLGLVVAALGGLTTVAASTPLASAGGCTRTVTGGTGAERAAVNRILCRMPGTRIVKVALLPGPAGAPSETLTVGIVIRGQPGDARANAFALQARAGWEAEVAAGAIRDGFVRLGLRRVVAFATGAGKLDVEARFLRPLARPEWKLGHWSVRPGIRGVGKIRDGTWATLAGRLRRDARRFHVGMQLEQYNPFGKAPIVTVRTTQPSAFLQTALRSFQADLAMGGRQFDGALLSVESGGRIVFIASATHRTAVTTSCAAYVRRFAGHACRFS